MLQSVEWSFGFGGSRSGSGGTGGRPSSLLQLFDGQMRGDAGGALPGSTSRKGSREAEVRCSAMRSARLPSCRRMQVVVVAGAWAWSGLSQSAGSSSRVVTRLALVTGLA